MGLRKINTIGLEQKNKVMHLGHCAKPEKVPEIRPKTNKKRGRTACVGGIGEKYRSIAIWRFPKASKIGFRLLSRHEKSPVKGLISFFDRLWACATVAIVVRRI